jgi:hypothetical protein
MANTMSDFTQAARVGQVWQAQNGTFMHLLPAFKFTGQDNNKLVMEGVQWRTADNSLKTPTQSNTLQATDFPLTLRKDMRSVVMASRLFTFAEGLDVVNEQEEQEEQGISDLALHSAHYSRDGIELRLADDGDATDEGDVLRITVSVNANHTTYDEEVVTNISNILTFHQGTVLVWWLFLRIKQLVRTHQGADPQDFTESLTQFLAYVESLRLTDVLPLIQDPEAPFTMPTFEAALHAEAEGLEHMRKNIVEPVAYNEFSPETGLRCFIEHRGGQPPLNVTLYGSDLDDEDSEAEHVLFDVHTSIWGEVTPVEAEALANLIMREIPEDATDETFRALSTVVAHTTDADLKNIRDELLSMSSLRLSTTADALEDYKADGLPDEGELVVDGVRVRWSISHRPGYRLENDPQRLAELKRDIERFKRADNPRLRQSGVFTRRDTGEVFHWRLLGYAPKARRGGLTQTVVAATPVHQGEYTWEEFRRAVRPGQIWQTNNSLIRIDRLLHSAQDRRGARFIRFRGAWTGNGPKAVKALLPQKDGQYLNSTGPWSVSRRYGPFLLVNADVRQTPMGVEEEREEPLAISMPPDTPTTDTRSQKALLPPEAQEGLKFGGLRTVAEGLDIMEVEDARKLYDAWKEFMLKHYRVDESGAKGVAFNVKLPRMNIPEIVRERLSGDTIEAALRSFAIATRDNLDQFMGEAPWYQGAAFVGRSDGWLMVEVDDNELYKGVPLQTTEDNFTMSFDDFLHTYTYLLRQELGAERVPPEHKILQEVEGALRFAVTELNELEYQVQTYFQGYIDEVESMDFWERHTGDPGVLASLKTHAEGLEHMPVDPVEALKQVQQFVDRYYRGYNHGGSGIAVNIKVYQLKIPKSIQRKLSAEQIDRFMGYQAEQYLEDIKMDYGDKPWFKGMTVEGRSGGWLMFAIDASTLFELPNMDDIDSYLVKADPQKWVEAMVADLRNYSDEYDAMSDTQVQMIIGDHLAKGLAELEALVSDVLKYKQYYLNDAASLEFWRDVLSSYDQ